MHWLEEVPYIVVNHHMRGCCCHSIRGYRCRQPRLLAIKIIGQDGCQLQFGKVDAVEEHNRHADSRKVESFKGGRMYNSQECLLQFAAEVIPIQTVPRTIDEGETLQTTEWELENGN